MNNSKFLFGMIETFLVHHYPFPVDLRTHISNIFIIAVIYSLKKYSFCSLYQSRREKDVVVVVVVVVFKKRNLMQSEETLKEQEFQGK